MEPQIVEKYGEVMIMKRNDGSHIYLISEVHFEAALEKILSDDHIEEVMYNGSHQPLRIFHHRYGMCDTTLHFSEDKVWPFIAKTAEYNNKTISQANPLLDGALSDGSRVNIIIPPASLTISITIRRFMHSTITMIDLIKEGMFTSDVAAYLWTCISRTGNPANILVIGGTASGKTTVLNALSMFIAQKERIIVIEDTPELQLKQPNIIRMIANPEREVDMDMLLKNALRMRPDRIIVGEVRGKEAITMFTAMNTGHDGCLGTLHANSAKDSIARITNPPMNVPLNMINALNLIIVLEKMPDGKRRVQEICEIAGVDSKNVRFNKIFEWNVQKNLCVSTEIPSRLKAHIAHDSGLSMTELDSIITKHKNILEELVQRNAQQDELLFWIMNG
jgi:flagellar protein FlaI